MLTPEVATDVVVADVDSVVATLVVTAALSAEADTVALDNVIAVAVGAAAVGAHEGAVDGPAESDGVEAASQNPSTVHACCQ